MSDSYDRFELRTPSLGIRIIRRMSPVAASACILSATAVLGLGIIRPWVLGSRPPSAGIYYQPSLIYTFFDHADVFYVVELLLALVAIGALLYIILTPRWARTKKRRSLPPRVSAETVMAPLRDADAEIIDTTAEFHAPAPELHEQVRATINRIDEELDALAVRVKLNLIIGILLAVVGLTALGYLVLTLPKIDPSTSSPWWYLAEFAPKLSFVLLIDIFAYFFLNLYKATLGDVKYFQNELTNFESRTLALSAAIQKGDAKVTAAVILELSKTERNFMKKDLTNLDLERAKAEQQSVSDILKHVASIVKVGSGGTDKGKEKA